MNFLQRFLGVFFNPKDTFKALAEKPVWHDALIALLLFSILFQFVIMPYSQQDNLQIMKNNVKMRERMGDEQFNRMLDRIENPPPVSLIIRSVVLTPLTLLIGFLLAALILFGMSRIVSTQGKYMQVFSAFLYANFIEKILGYTVRMLLTLVQKSFIQTTTSMALFFPRLEVTSPAFVVLSQIDFFQLWMFGIFGYALSSIFKIDIRKALFISLLFWLLKGLVYVAIGLISLRYMT